MSLQTILNTDTASSRLKELRTFLDDKRAGAASQIDFANGMVILLFGIIFFFAASTALVAAVDTTGTGDQSASFRVSNKLVGDIFLEQPGTNNPTRECIDGYFVGPPETSVCDHDSAWGNPSDGQSYLRNSLSLKPEQQAAVVLNDKDGNVYTRDGNTYRLGGTPPQGNVGKYQRRIAADMDDDGESEWYTLTIYVW